MDPCDASQPERPLPPHESLPGYEQARNEFAALMDRVREGSDEAVEELIDIYGPHVLRAVRRTMHRRMRARVDSSDFTQAVWASFFTERENLARLKSPDALLHYLCRMAHNKVALEFRRNCSEKYDVNRERSLDGSAKYLSEELVSGSPTPSRVLASQEAYARLLRRAAGERDQNRSREEEIVQMRGLGFSQESIARQLSITVRTVQRVLGRLLGKGKREP